MDFKHNVKWFVSLSNGETLYESKGNYCDIKGELWKQMQNIQP